MKNSLRVTRAFLIIGLFISTLSGCTLVDKVKIELGMEASAFELVKKGCAQYDKDGLIPGKKAIKFFRDAVDKDDKYRTLFGKVSTVELNHDLAKSAKDNPQVLSVIVNRILENNEYVRSFCK